MLEHCTLLVTTTPLALLVANVHSALVPNSKVFPVLVTPAACSPLQYAWNTVLEISTQVHTSTPKSKSDAHEGAGVGTPLQTQSVHCE